jgi:hypothetical protein
MTGRVFNRLGISNGLILPFRRQMVIPIARKL